MQQIRVCAECGRSDYHDKSCRIGLVQLYRMTKSSLDKANIKLAAVVEELEKSRPEIWKLRVIMKVEK